MREGQGDRCGSREVQEHSRLLTVLPIFQGAPTFDSAPSLCSIMPLWRRQKQHGKLSPSNRDPGPNPTIVTDSLATFKSLPLSFSIRKARGLD